MRKKSSILFLLRIVKMMIGVINLSLTAKYFGVSFNKDIWILAITLTLFLDAIVWGPINETFRTKFIFLKTEVGEIEALQKTKGLIFFTIIFSLVIVGAVEFFPEVLVKLAAPTFQDQQIVELITMVRFAAPVLLINQLTLLGISILNAFNSFFIPEISGFFTSVFNLLLIIILAPIIGIYSLLISYYIGVIILLIMIIYQINKLKIDVFKGYTAVRFKDFTTFFLYALPFFLPYFFGQIASLLEKTLASTLGVGNVSTIDYSRKFTDILTGVLTSVLITMLVPVLSEKFAKKKHNDFVSSFMQMYQLGFLFVTFVISLFLVSSDSIVDLFYNRGAITEQSLKEISQLTMYYSWSALGVFFYLIFGLALLSSGQNKLYAFYGVSAQIISILLNLLFINKYGIFIFPFSLFISHFLAGVIMFYKFPFISKKISTISFRYLFVLIIIGSIMFLVNYSFVISLNPILNICLNSSLIVVLLLIMMFAFNLEEKNIIMTLIKKIK